MFEPRTDISNAWRGIVENAEVLKQGVRTEIGNGKKTMFWYHSWVFNSPLC